MAEEIASNYNCFNQRSISNYCVKYSNQLFESDFSPSINYIENEKRGVEALEESLSELGLVYLVKKDPYPQQKREPQPESKHIKKRFFVKKRFHKKRDTSTETPTTTTSSPTTNAVTSNTVPTTIKSPTPSGPSITSDKIPTSSEIPTTTKSTSSSKTNATSTSSAATSTATYPSVKEIMNNYTDYKKPLVFTYNSTEQYNSYLKELQEIFVNPPQAILNKDGWPPLNIYDPRLDTMFWWRNDPVSNQHHELWHIVMVSTIIDGVRKDREGENFVYMHRHMLSRYDADRLGVGLDIVEPLPDYRTPIIQPFYPNPHLYQDNDSNPETPNVWFVARPANESIKDMVQLMGTHFFIYKIEFLEHLYNELVKWVNHEYTPDHPVQLGWNDSEATTFGSQVELNLHNIGHSVLGYIMHPYSIGYPPSVLVGARGGLRDPLFWRWHRHLDNLYLSWQKKLGPNNFSEDCPNVTIKATDIYFSFTDVLIKAEPDGKADSWQSFGNKTFGGNNFYKDLSNSTYVTSELQTKMKSRNYTWLEDNYDTDNVSYVFPRDWHYFFRVENNVGITSIITIRIFICPTVLANSTVHWIELDKFKRSLQPYEKAVISRACDKAIVIRKPAQKNETEMDATAITQKYRTYLTKYNDKEKAELLFCNCGWPYNMIIPRGTKEGMKFKIIAFISDGLNDLVPTYDQCGSTLLCGGQKWTDKIPDIKPLGYPFNRPFKDDSFEKTFAGLSNVAIKDFTIKLVNDFPEVS